MRFVRNLVVDTELGDDGNSSVFRVLKTVAGNPDAFPGTPLDEDLPLLEVDILSLIELAVGQMLRLNPLVDANQSSPVHTTLLPPKPTQLRNAPRL